MSLWDEAEEGKSVEEDSNREYSIDIDSTNSYLQNPIKGMELLATIIREDTHKSSTPLDKVFEKFEKFIEDDFMNFSSQVALSNEAELYSRLMGLKSELAESIEFAELVNKTHIGIGGSFSAGKSSFLNSILGRDIYADDILPVDSTPTTSIPTYIVQKEIFDKTDEIDTYIFNHTGDKSKIDREALQAISHEFYKIYNFGLISIIDKIVIDIASMPYNHIAFIDTPGYSKSDGDSDIDQNIAKEHLQNIDSLIWLIDVDNGTIRDGDIKFIQELNFGGDILFVLNKADKKPLSDIEQIIHSIKENLQRANIGYSAVVAYSSHNQKEYISDDTMS